MKMNTNRFAAFTAGVVVMIILASAVLVPTIDGARMTTTTVSNEGAGWAKFAYYEDAEDYSVALSSDGTTLTMGAQSGTADDMIVWASDSAAVIHDGGSFTLLYGDGDSSAAADLGSSATIASVSGALTITDSSSTGVYTSDAVEWTYTPNAGGSFGFFTDSGATVKDFPVATAGTFAGAYAYNEINSLGHSTLAPTYSVTDGVFTTGPWAVPDLNAKSKSIRISDIEQIKKESESLIKATTYTDGDWTFDFYNNFCRVVKYTGPNGDITLPTSLSDGTDTYTPTRITGASNSVPVFGSSFVGTVTIPDQYVSASYFSTNCTGLTEVVLSDNITFLRHLIPGATGVSELNLPTSLQTIETGTFDGSGLTGIILPESLTASYGGFRNCLSLKSVVVLGNGSFNSGEFSGSPVEEVLNLGTTSITAGSYGLPADVVVSNELPSLGYIAPVSFSETTAQQGAVYDMLAVIPILVIASIMLTVAGMIILRRE